MAGRLQRILRTGRLHALGAAGRVREMWNRGNLLWNSSRLHAWPELWFTPSLHGPCKSSCLIRRAMRPLPWVGPIAIAVAETERSIHPD